MVVIEMDHVTVSMDRRSNYSLYLDRLEKTQTYPLSPAAVQEVHL